MCVSLRSGERWICLYAAANGGFVIAPRRKADWSLRSGERWICLCAGVKKIKKKNKKKEKKKTSGVLAAAENYVSLDPWWH